MLDDDMAQKLIDRFSGTTKYNINIMNESGIIIASRDRERVGTFHETAYRMLAEHKPSVEVYAHEKLLGTKPGINMLLENKNTAVGVVGITGDPDEVRPLVLLLKASMESLLEFELLQNARMDRIGLKDRFFQQLLYLDEPDALELNTQAKELGYQTACTRIPILFAVEQQSDRDIIAEVCKTSGQHTKQDILIRTADQQICVFLRLEPTFSVFGEYRSLVEDYLLPVRKFAQARGIRCAFYVGTIQSELKLYHMAYWHCKWLKKYRSQPEETITYFYDHLFQYIQSLVPLTELDGVFKSYVQGQPDGFWDNYVQVVSAMTRNNNNLAKSAGALHMHKNTLVYRYNKIREGLSIDPLSDMSDLLLSIHLCYYLESR